VAHHAANISSFIFCLILEPKPFIYLPEMGYKVKVLFMHAKKAHMSGSRPAILRFDIPVVLSN
jgi:hypothetical protein